MRKFLSKTILITIIFFAIYGLAIEAVFHFYPGLAFSIFKQEWMRTKKRLDDSKKVIKNDTLYVGCSVAQQLLPNNKPNQLTTNGSTYAIGNYFLIKNAIEKNKNIKTVIYLAVPDVIGHKLARERTYNYFVKPFYTFENRKEIMEDKYIGSILKRNLLLPFCLLNSFKTIKMDDFNYEDHLFKRSDSLSIESIVWLKKIKTLCEENDVTFYLASPPVQKSRQINSSNWNIIKKQVADTELEEMFNIYFNTIIYLDDKYLKDNIHWDDDYIDDHRIELLNQIKKSLPD